MRKLKLVHLRKLPKGATPQSGDYLFNICLLHLNDVPGTGLDTGDIKLNQTWSLS